MDEKEDNKKNFFIYYTMIVLLLMILIFILFIALFVFEKNRHNKDIQQQINQDIYHSNEPDDQDIFETTEEDVTFNEVNEDKDNQSNKTKSIDKSKYPYAVNIDSLFINQELLFRPKPPSNIGTLNEGLSIRLQNNDLQHNQYILYFSHHYSDAYTQFLYTGTYQAKINQIDTIKINVQSFESSDSNHTRSVHVNTQIKVLAPLDIQGEEFNHLENTSLYLFYAADQKISLAFKNNEQSNIYSEYQLMNNEY